MASFFDELFGDNQDAFNNYASAYDRIAQNYAPLIGMGQQGMTNFYNQNQNLLTNPNQLQDTVARGFYESPYQAEMMRRTQEIMNSNAANTGMLGSGLANRKLQDEMIAMSGQFMNDYINRGMGSFYKGLEGMGGIGQTWMPAVNAQSGAMGEAAGGRLQGEISHNAVLPRALGMGLGAAGAIAGMPIGGGSITMGNGMTRYEMPQTVGGWAFNKLGGNPRSGTMSLGY